MTPTDPHTKSSKSAKARAAANQATIPPSATTSASRETIPPSQADSVPNPGVGHAPLGRAFGRYQILECLGQGAMGAVYKARDLQLDRIVALKIPKLSEPSEPGLLERFYREARAAATLNHPNLCPVYDVGEHAGTHYISMGYIDGRPLSDFIKPGKPLPERKAVGVIRKLAIALAEAHRQGIVHRDLKPDNVMIDQRGQPIVMDFGLAQQTKTEGDIRATQSGQMLGTPAYMSTEQVDGDLDRIGPASDVYSLGVILYELLTGELPYQGSVASVLAQIIKGEPAPPSHRMSGLDPNLEAVCLKMMAADADRRYPSMPDVTKALTEWSKGESAAAATPREKTAPAEEESDEGLAALFHVVDAETKPVRETLSPQSRRTIRPQTQKSTSPQHKEQPLWQKPWVRWTAGGLAAGLLLLGILLFVRVGDETVKIEIDDPNAQVFVDGNNVDIKNLGATIELRPGEHNLEVRRGDVVVQTDRFEVVQGKNRVLKVSVVEPRQKAPVTVDLDPPTADLRDDASAIADDTTGSDNQGRFVDRGKYVEDKKTGLLWQKDGDASGKLNFYQAADYAKELKLGGLSDWRVPTRKELAAIFPATEKPFQDTKYTPVKCCEGPYEWNSYWTSELDKRLDDYAYVYQWYADGGANNCFASKNYGYVRCVHDPIGEKSAENRRETLEDGERQFAEWFFEKEKRGRMTVLPDDGNRTFSLDEAGDIPDLDFEILHIIVSSPGTIPADRLEQVASFPSLVSLTTSGKAFDNECLRILSQSKDLRSLTLRSSGVTDEGFRHLAKMQSLRSLELKETPITSAGISSWNRLTGLMHLRIVGAEITEEFAETISQMRGLTLLGLEKSTVTEASLKRIATLPRLSSLQLSESNVTDRALRALSNTQSLSSLGLDNTDISDEGLAHLEELKNLSHLTLHGSKMTDQGVKKSLSRLTKLEHLRISDTPITNEGLLALEDLPALEFLTVQETGVTQAGLDRFQEAKPRCRIYPKTISPPAD